MCVRVSILLGDSICMGDLVGINFMWATILSILCGRRFCVGDNFCIGDGILVSARRFHVGDKF